MAGDVLLLFSTCKLLCPKRVGLDRHNGTRLWTADLPASGLSGAAGVHAALQLTDGQFLTDAAGVDLRTEEVTRRIEGTGGHDRYAMVPGMTRLAHYSHTGHLRLVDLATGQATATVPVAPHQDTATPDLYATVGEVVLATRRPAACTTRPVSPSGGPGTPPCARSRRSAVRVGRQRWQSRRRRRPASTVFLGTDGGSWASPPTPRTPAARRSITSTSTLAGDWPQDDHATAYREPGAVLQADALDDEGGTTFWYLALPSGQSAALGSTDVLTSTCALGPALAPTSTIKCRLGLWRYR